jgi:hypothetical protein
VKQIEQYVDMFYLNVRGRKNEIQELKEEMKSHLYETVYELKSEGKSESEAVELAIKRFGGGKELRDGIGAMFVKQRYFAKTILYIAIAFLLIPSLLFLYYWNTESDYSMDADGNLTYFIKVVGDHNTITEEMKTKIERVVNIKPYIYNVKIYDSEKLFSEGKRPSPVYEYRKGDLNALADYLRDTSLGIGGLSFGNEQWYFKVELKSYNELLSNLILPIGVIIYWVLFTIWATINAFHQRRLNLGWIITFSLFNVVGYLLFYLVGKKKKQLLFN